MCFISALMRFKRQAKPQLISSSSFGHYLRPFLHRDQWLTLCLPLKLIHFLWSVCDWAGAWLRWHGQSRGWSRILQCGDIWSLSEGIAFFCLRNKCEWTHGYYSQCSNENAETGLNFTKKILITTTREYGSAQTRSSVTSMSFRLPVNGLRDGPLTLCSRWVPPPVLVYCFLFKVIFFCKGRTVWIKWG